MLLATRFALVVVFLATALASPIDGAKKFGEAAIIAQEPQVGGSTNEKPREMIVSKGNGARVHCHGTGLPENSAPSRTVLVGSEPVITGPSAAASCGTTTTTLVAGPTYTPCAIDGTKAWDGTQTIYPGTVTVPRYVDCHGCDSIEVVRPREEHCPSRPAPRATVTATTASRQWMTLCASPRPTAAGAGLLPAVTAAAGLAEAGSSDEERARLELARRDGLELVGCPYTYLLNAPLATGATITVYQQTLTLTVRVDCGFGCNQIVPSTILAQGGPQRKISATVTLGILTASTYSCM